MPRGRDEDSPIVKLVNMLLLNMIKRPMRTTRVRVDGPTERWEDGAWVEEMAPPAKIRPHMIDRIKEMAEIPDDATIHFDATIRLIVGEGRRKDYDVTYARSAGGGVIVLALSDDARDDASDRDVMHKAWIMLQHAEDALARDEVRARIRDAVARVMEQPGRAWFFRSASNACVNVGLYDDALELMDRARLLNAKDPYACADIEAQSGIVLVEMNRVKEGERALRRSVEIAETLPRPCFYEVKPLMNLATLALDRGDLDGAASALARIDDLAATFFGPPCAADLLTRALRVRLLRARGDGIRAELLAEESLREIEEIGLAGEAEQVHAELAESALARGDAKTAIDHLREVLQLPSRSPMRARIWVTLSRAQRSIGLDADAVASLRAAIALTHGALAPDHPLHLEIERDLSSLTAATPYR